jgi:broad specificity phosphatase PhoE
MRVFLVRHGQTSWNIEGKAQGHTDIPLDEVGLRQCESLHHAFKGTRLDQIISSDLKRAQQTAEAISAATGAPIVLEPRLRERCFGEWEGDSYADVSSRLIEAALDKAIRWVLVRPPGGESFMDVWDRVGAFVDGVFDSDEDIAIVSHGGTSSAVMARLIHGHPETARSFRFGNTGIYELERRNDGFFSIVRYNDTHHLTAHPEVIGR